MVCMLEQDVIPTLPEFTAQAVLEALTGAKDKADICRELSRGRPPRGRSRVEQERQAEVAADFHPVV